jgi:hypothetical protein
VQANCDIIIFLMFFFQLFEYLFFSRSITSYNLFQLQQHVIHKILHKIKKKMSKTKSTSLPESSENVDLVVNAGLHVLILVSILFGVFIFVVQPLTQSAFQSQMQTLATTATNSALTQMNTADNGSTKKTIQNNSNVLNAAENLFANPDAVRSVHNSWLLGCTALFICLFATMLLIFLVTVRLVGGQRVPIWNILKQNLVAFVFIGMIEVWFFITVASQYIPTPPSALTKTIVCRARQNLLGPAMANCSI